MTTGRNPQPDRSVDPQCSDQQMVLVFKVLSHPFRLELLRLLSGEEPCVCHQDPCEKGYYAVKD